MKRRFLAGAVALMMGLFACSEESADPAVGDLTCTGGEILCNGACAEVATDPRNCGACGTQCGAGEVCSGGACAAACPAGQTACDGGCFDLQSAAGHCGACGVACEGSELCVDGSCETVCPDGQVVCADGCATLATSATHCGACGNACDPDEVCADGTCRLDCPAGQEACDGGCFDVTSSAQHCGACGTSCAAGEICEGGACVVACADGMDACDGTCRSLGTDRNNCGACGTTCSADQACVDGNCTVFCADGLLACDGACKDVNADRNNCGACGNACGDGEVCDGGSCTPTCGGFASTLCDGACTNTDVDPANCGGCGTACDAGEVCSDGACAAYCPATSDECGGSCTSVEFDPANCGSCGNACAAPANAKAACSAGSCTSLCLPGYEDCNGGSDGCEAHLASDPTNCGACGAACPTPANGTASCVAGACGLAACAPGYGDCDLNPSNGCEGNFASDPLHCGGCNLACAPGDGCVDGACVPAPLGDTCSNPVMLTDGLNIVNWEGSGQDYLTASPSCSTSTYTPVGGDVVLRYDATRTGNVDLYFANKPASTRWHIVVSEGACGSLTPQIGCLSDFTPVYLNGTFPAVAGGTYWIYVSDSTSGSLPLSNPFDLYVSTGDCVTPPAAGVWPGNGTMTNTLTPTLQVIFPGPVDKTTGTITLTGNLGTTRSFTLPNAAVTFDTPGRVMTINPGAAFPGGEQITVTWTGLQDTGCSAPVPAPAWTFTILDCAVYPPATVTTVTPAIGGFATALQPTMVANFSRPVNTGAGTITVTGNLGTNLSYALPNSAVTFSTDKQQVTIRPAARLPAGEQLTVSWTGITDVTCSAPVAPPAWNFTVPVPPCTPGQGGMVGNTITRMPTTILGGFSSENYVAVDTDPNGWVYVGGTSSLYRAPKNGGPTQNVYAMAGLSSSHLGYTMVIDGPNIYTVESKTSGTSGHLFRISTTGGASWEVVDAANFPATPNDDLRAAAAWRGKIYLMTDETTAGNEIWSVDVSGTLPATAVLETTFGTGLYDECSSIAVDDAYYYVTCQNTLSTSRYPRLRIDRTTGEIVVLTDEYDGNTTSTSLSIKDANGDGIADFLYAASDNEEGYSICQPASSLPWADLLYSFGTGTGNYGHALDPVSNTLWAWDDDTAEFIKVQ